MFQPQPTPYSPFSSSAYGIDSPAAAFPAFLPAAALESGGPGGPTVFRNTLFRPTTNASTSTATFAPNHRLPRRYEMESTGSADMAAQQTLARDFQPDLQGPLVGEKKSSQAIAAEYAKADPVYVAKTAALPQKYSHYRPILGDGNCGWRAAAFAYFETLLRLRNNKAQLEEEVARMISLNNFLTTIGQFEAWIFEDMVEETTNLLKDLANLVQSSPQKAADLLRQRFNDPEVSAAIIYHFRLLASSWLQGNSVPYEDFIQDELGVDGYRKNWLELPNQEIDHLGMSLLIDALLKPLGFSVEIVYLDRSEGTQVNSHIMQPEENGVPTNPGGPMIHLLYRPSHYDILYKEPPTRHPQEIQVKRAANLTHQISIQSTPMGDFSATPYDFNALISIPGFSGPPAHHSFSQYNAPIEQTYAPSPISSISPISPGTSSATTPSSTALPASFQTQTPPQAPIIAPPPLTSPPHQSFPPTTSLPIHSPPIPHQPSLTTHSSLSSELSSPTSAGSSFRPSKYEWEAAADWAQEGPVQFQTSTFKNSHYNTAHYNNPNFQPEEWSPDVDEQTVTRKKST